MKRMKTPKGRGGRMQMSDVLARIKETYRDMTPGFQAIAQYVTDHHQELAFASVARVASLAGSSAATVVRFSEFIGLSGYSELQAIAREELRNEVNTVSRLERSQPNADPTSIYEAVVRADIANLNAMLETRNAEAFDKAVKILAAADTIHLAGLRSNHGLVKHLEPYLGWIGRPANLLTPGIGDLSEQLMAVKPGDACLSVSLHRYSHDTIKIARAAKAMGADLIAITDSELSPLAEVAMLSLLVPAGSPAFFESKTAVLTLMNALLLGIALADRPRTIKSLKRHEQAWVDREIYVNENHRSPLIWEEAFNFASRGGGVRPSSNRPVSRKPRTTPGKTPKRI